MSVGLSGLSDGVRRLLDLRNWDAHRIQETQCVAWFPARRSCCQGIARHVSGRPNGLPRKGVEARRGRVTLTGLATPTFTESLFCVGEGVRS